MSAVGHIKRVIREIQPVLDDNIQSIMYCLESLRSCGVFTEEMQELVTSIESIESVTEKLKDRLVEFNEYDNLSGEED